MIHYYLKKIQYFFFKKYGFTKHSLDYFNNNKKKPLSHFLVLKEINYQFRKMNFLVLLRNTIFCL
jgi:hypothetical protein